MTVRVVLVGAGRWARNIARVLSSIEEADFCGVVDIRFDAAKELASIYGVKPFNRLSEAISICKPEAGLVAVTPSNLPLVSRELIKSGVHVFVEKPVAFSAREAEVLKKDAKEAGVIVVPGFIMRFNPVIMWLKKHVSFKKLAEAFFYRLSRRPPRLRSTPIVFDLAIHDIDTALWFFNELKPLQAVLVETYLDEGFYATFQASSVIVNMSVSGFSPIKYRLVRLVSEDYLLEANTDTLEVSQRLSWGSSVRLKVEGEEPLRAEIRTFLARVDGSSTGYEWVQPSLDDAIRALKLVEMSLATAKKVMVS
ncbi:MAG TPA: Gfo/Idh/MocA family oxidoreductase [Pyrodictium sp.]|nr:Gfo/Idh/MocA family oxidoreductase [Pyrodictium sp.]